MQIYRDMQIATAKPTETEKCGIVHHLMDFLPVDEDYSVAMFVRDASECIRKISSVGKLPIITGGTGLYVDSLLNNIKFSEEKRDESVCNELWSIYSDQGIDPLLSKLQEIDEITYDKLKIQRNPKRIIRAIEFYITTGEPISSQVANSKPAENPYLPIKIGLNFRNREKLYDRINRRVDSMIEKGLVKEAEKVLSQDLSFTSVKAIGYKELIPYFKHEKTLEECIERLKQETRRYAKRQITWFKRDKNIHWLYVDEFNSYSELFDSASDIISKEMKNG